MSILTAKKKSNLLLSNWKAFKRGLIMAMMQEYYSKKEIRNISNVKTKEIDWFKPLEKGCLAYFKENKMPLRGIMMMEEFQNANLCKRSIPFFAHFINGTFGFKKKNVLEKIFILVSLKIHYEFYLKFIHNALYDSFLDNPDKYSQPVRELYRVLTEFPMERDIACFFLESDHAYRYRWQDIFSLLDKVAFLKNPLKETLRLFEILMSRENKFFLEGGLWHKWKMFKGLITIFYWYARIFQRKLLKKIMKIVEEINLDEIRPSPEDKYWMNTTSTYDFGGISWGIRKLLNT